MKIVDIAEAEIHLEELVEEAATGQPFQISRNGEPVVIVEPYDPA